MIDIEQAAKTISLQTSNLASIALDYIGGDTLAGMAGSNYLLIRKNIEEVLKRFIVTRDTPPASAKDCLHNYIRLCGFLRGLYTCLPATKSELEGAIISTIIDINVSKLYDAVDAPKTAFATFRNSDMTEGRGPMRLDRVFLNREHAASYVDEQPGVFGRREKWSENDNGDWEIHEIELIDYDVTEKQKADEARRRELLDNLSDDDLRILGVKVG